MSMFNHGDRVVVNDPFVGGVPYSWHGKRGVVVREPGEEATPGYGPSTTYAVLFDNEPYASAPFRDATMDDRPGSLIEADDECPMCGWTAGTNTASCAECAIQ